MAEADGVPTARVLHIAAPHAGVVVGPVRPEFDIAVRDAGVGVERVGDVYRGLAELCLPDTPRLMAAVVCVDDLGPPEMEFFSLAARCRPGVPLWVYTNRASPERVARAVASGATGEFTPAALQELARSGSCSAAFPMPDHGARSFDPTADPADAADGASRPDLETQSQRDSQRAAASCSDGIPVETVRGVAAEPWAEPRRPDGHDADASANGGGIRMGTQSSGDVTPDADDLPAGPVRVPWLRYDDTPVRSAPRRAASGVEGHRSPTPSPPSSSRGLPEQPATPASETYEPLLTEEELRALLGEDFGIGEIGDDGARAVGGQA